MTSRKLIFNFFSIKWTLESQKNNKICYRLASLSLTAFSSFGRAFKGNKFNPLRNRIDSINLDIRQLFLVTIFFIILLFLLPTIGIYFLVFGLVKKNFFFN